MQPKYAKYCHMGSKHERKHRGICMYGRISDVPLLAYDRPIESAHVRQKKKKKKK